MRLFSFQREKKVIPAVGPGAELRLKFRLRFQEADLSAKHFDRAALDGKEQANRFAEGEFNRPLAGETPVHGEGAVRPIGFHDAIQRRDSVLRIVGWAAHHQIPAIRGLEEKWYLKGQDPVAEMRHAMERTITANVLDP